MLRGILTAAAICVAAIAPANADVTAKAPDGFVIQIKGEVALNRDGAWARLLDIGSWWNGSHTYSGDAVNMKLDAMAGGCWCELWAGGEIEHGRVVMVMPMSTVRVDAALGPLQELGVSGAMTITLADGAAGRTAITLDYKVSGSSLSKLDGLADIVNQVLSEQVSGFTKLD
jgi:hypothetical protein